MFSFPPRGIKSINGDSVSVPLSRLYLDENPGSDSWRLCWGKVDLLLVHPLCESILALVCFCFHWVFICLCYLFHLSILWLYRFIAFIALYFSAFIIIFIYALDRYFLFGGMRVLRDKPITRA